MASGRAAMGKSLERIREQICRLCGCICRLKDWPGIQAEGERSGPENEEKETGGEDYEEICHFCTLWAVLMRSNRKHGS